MFRTKYSRVETITPSGDPYVIDYSARYDDAGVLILEPTGKTCLYDEIQSHAESVDLNNIIRRYENGEIDVLSRAQGVYEDITDAPRTYAEMLNMINAAREIYELLPADLRAEYNNSFEQFFAQDGMSRIRPDSEKPVESTVSADVTDEKTSG